MTDLRKQMREFGLEEELEDDAEEAMSDALKANLAAVDLIARLKEKLEKGAKAHESDCLRLEKRIRGCRTMLYAERKEYHAWVRAVTAALGIPEVTPTEYVVPFASGLVKELAAERIARAKAERDRDDWEAKYMTWHDAALEAEHATRINAEREVEQLEEKVDFGVSVMGELRSQIEELREANLKLRQDLRKENNEFQDLKVQYEQRESEVIYLRGATGTAYETVAEKAIAWDLLAPDRERAFKLLEGTPSEMPGMSWAHCLCEEVERLRRVLKLTEALVPTHVPIKRYEEARREIEGLRSLQRRVEQCLREHYAAQWAATGSVAHEVIESIAKELEIDYLEEQGLEGKTE